MEFLPVSAAAAGRCCCCCGQSLGSRQTDLSWTWVKFWDSGIWSDFQIETLLWTQYNNNNNNNSSKTWPGRSSCPTRHLPQEQTLSTSSPRFAGQETLPVWSLKYTSYKYIWFANMKIAQLEGQGMLPVPSFKNFSGSWEIETRLTYNCAHLRLSKESWIW